MTKTEEKEVREILEFLKKNKSITYYDIKGNVIEVKTDIKDEEELDFLDFRIMSTIIIVNVNFKDTVSVKFIE